MSDELVTSVPGESPWSYIRRQLANDATDNAEARMVLSTMIAMMTPKGCLFIWDEEEL